MRSGISFAILLVTLGVHAEINPLRESPVVKAVGRVESAVVNISTEKIVSVRGFNPYGDDWISSFFNSQPYRNITRQSLGSGVIFRPDGTILTNEHIILPASKITVTLSDGMEYEAEMLGASRRFDLALLKISRDEPFPYLSPARSDDLLIGEPVIAIGNPFGLSSTVTTGVISALHRTITFQDQQTRERHTYYDFIQTDASINPGNSGGPLLNILGELIGINTAIYQNAEGIGFAIPIEKANRVVTTLLEKGKIPRVWLGVQVQELTPLLAEHLGVNLTNGVLVSDVRPGSPGDSGGIMPGDVIQKIGLSRILTPDDFRDRVKDYTPGEIIPVSLFRSGKSISIDLQAAEFTPRRQEDLSWELLGMRINDISKSPFQEYQRIVNRGIVITDVRQGSPAESAGLARGDLILRIDRVKIETPEQYYETVSNASNQDSLSLVIIRRTTPYRVTIPID